MKHSTRLLRKILTLILCVAFLAPLPPAQAQHNTGPVLIRDTEIENIFAQWSAPLLKQAGIGENNAKVILVQSSEINAFVAGGANIFVYTGLIDKTQRPGEILGVLAHEIGHIAGGHLIKTRDAFERASYESMLGIVLGIGAAIATGDGQAAGAIIGGSQGIAQRRFLAHSRINESSADQAAYSYLNGAKLDTSGLGSFLKKIESQEFLPVSQQSEYMRTHPVTRSRIEAVEALSAKNADKSKPLPPEWIDQYARMKAKLIGFINPGQVAWTYDDKDRSIPARYARTIAAYRQNEIDSALTQINALIKEEPDNPYFHELKGQILFEFSRVAEAIPPYERAVALLPDAPLLRIALAHARIENAHGDKNALKEAIADLERALTKEESSARAHRLLATAYGQLGQDTLARLHLAEEAVLQRRLPYAKEQAARALKETKPQSREWLKAKDLLAHIENLERLKPS